MDYKVKVMNISKRIALVAHDNKKQELIDWAKYNKGRLKKHTLCATGTTGKLLEDLGFNVIRFQSGPLGGDQQIGAKISEGEIDILMFFWDPLEPQPHDPDIKALLRIASVWNIPNACTKASADFLFSSILMEEEYERMVPDYDTYTSRKINIEKK